MTTTTTNVYDGHMYSDEYWPPDYIGIKNGRLTIDRKNELCPRCREGKHDTHMMKTGCLRAVDPAPWDYVCLCKEDV